MVAWAYQRLGQLLAGARCGVLMRLILTHDFLQNWGDLIGETEYRSWHTVDMSLFARFARSDVRLEP